MKKTAISLSVLLSITLMISSTFSAANLGDTKKIDLITLKYKNSTYIKIGDAQKLGLSSITVANKTYLENSYERKLRLTNDMYNCAIRLSEINDRNISLYFSFKRYDQEAIDLYVKSTKMFKEQAVYYLNRIDLNGNYLNQNDTAKLLSIYSKLDELVNTATAFNNYLINNKDNVTEYELQNNDFQTEVISLYSAISDFAK